MDIAGKFNRWRSYKMSKEQQDVILHRQADQRSTSAYTLRSKNSFENVKYFSEVKNKRTIGSKK